MSLGVNLFRVLPSIRCAWASPPSSVVGCHKCWRLLSSAPPKRPFIMKVESPEFKGLFTPSLLDLIACFSKHNYEIRIAGGAVRDILLGKLPKDVDFATTATPDQMKAMFESEGIRMINMKGEKHGTITARIDNSNFEVTTLRIDVATDGRHAEVLFTQDWEVDANRRDLTINSMFLGVDGTLYDYFGGYEDLKKRRVLFVGDAQSRIREDYLRILRYFRFYGRIAEDPHVHDEATLLAIKVNIEGLKKISGERVWMELSKILSGNYAGEMMEYIINVGASPFIGLPATANVPEMKSVWAKGKSLDLHPITLIVSLFRSIDEFLVFHARCKLSVFERELGLFVIRERHYSKPETDAPLKPFQVMFLKSSYKESDTKVYLAELFKYHGDLELLDQFNKWNPPKFPVNGNHLKKHGVPPGKVIGEVISALKDLWIAKDFEPSMDDLLAEVPSVLQGIKSVPQSKKS